MFQKFAELVKAQFDQMSKHELFALDVNSDEVWQKYLASFPAGTNPIFRERTEHDCSCCRGFVKNLGNVVAIIDGTVVSIWDGITQRAEHPYNIVAEEVSNFVKAKKIKNAFRTSEMQFGKKVTYEEVDGRSKAWHHFEGVVAKEFRVPKGTVDAVLAQYTSIVQVFERGLRELKRSDIQTVLDLVKDNAIYRGQEFKDALVGFSKLIDDYEKAPVKEIFIWQNHNDRNARFRNTVIGTLIDDLSSGVSLDKAVASFESKVAPQNYKRPSALITPRMIEDALKTLADEGLESAVERRFAKISDVSVNNVLFVDNAVRGEMKGGLKDLLMTSAKREEKVPQTAINISIEEFMSAILPKATGIDMLVETKHAGNFVSLTAPVHADSKSLFLWKNDFGWSYDGGVTDSIKERVKRAGGNVTNAQMRVSLAWFNTDDLDIHVQPPSGSEIYYGNKQDKLDVDMNDGWGKPRKDAVENVSWKRGSLQDGIYVVTVNNYNKRETSDVGFELEVEFEGAITRYQHVGDVKGRVRSLDIEIKGGKLIGIKHGKHIVQTSGSIEKWGIKTETMVPVNTMMFSPNYWDENAVGNKHWFFILKDCVNPDATRGIYNEFLSSKLVKHRKVFEVLGDKTKCAPTTEQLSGLGFSSTRGDEVLVTVTSGNIKTNYSIKF